MLYTVGYLYEHREQADHHELMLGTEYDHYRDNQTYVGRAADASKYAIESKQKGYLHEGVYNIEKAIYDKYCNLDDMFKAMVDPSPKARINTDVIENIKCDYRRQAETSDIVGRVLENSSRYLEQEFGDLGYVTQINYNGVRAIYDEFNGNGGMLDKCIKRMEDYETEALTSVDNSQLDYQVSDLQGAITRAAGGLNDMKTYDPSMPKNSISLVALGANMGVANAALSTAQRTQNLTMNKINGSGLKLTALNAAMNGEVLNPEILRGIEVIIYDILMAGGYAIEKIEGVIKHIPALLTLSACDGALPIGDLIALGILAVDAVIIIIRVTEYLWDNHCINESKKSSKSGSKAKKKGATKGKQKVNKREKQKKNKRVKQKKRVILKKNLVL